VKAVLRPLVLALVLALTALVVPDSATHPTEVALVKIQHASGVDLSPDVVWILAVGSDARPGEDMTHTRGDALQLVGINTLTGAAAAIGVPRDSWVPIPGVGSNKINASLYYGGPELLGETVGNLVGIQPDYVFVTRFPFFIAMVKSIGGVYVDNPVAFADRSANQQRTLRGIQAKIRARADEPGFLERGVLSVMENMHTDLSPAELFTLAEAAAQIDPSKITNCVVQGGIGSIGGASVVLPYTDQAARLGDRARKDATLESCD
jgi:anionic cell wall polymer biosynthesis LytR-Cps2A-Psr (LCP) family protein